MSTKDIWNLYANDIKHFILSKVKDTTIADDLLQETFIKVHTKIETLKDKSKLKPWLFSIARYTVYDYFKQHVNSHEISDIDIISKDSILEHNEKDCLYGIVKTLPKKYRDPLFLSDIKGVKQNVIAQQLKLKLSTTKSRIQRARKLIAQGYIDCCDFKMNDKGILIGEVKEKEQCKVCN
ncbi:RNA polymerase subunit sigma-70 [Flavobacteriales bacterium 33_180_T64]|nr:RNA polymerase subunit sigma-70 [Flavobacteriales bacterium 33_180_T64]